MPLESQNHLFRFDEFEIDLRTRELRRGSKLIKLQDLPIRLLILLASRAGQLVTREEIEQELWGEDHFVDYEHGINTAMRKVREALGENPETPRFIETMPRKGYRFIATLERAPDATGIETLPSSEPSEESNESQFSEGLRQSSRGGPSANEASSQEFALPTAPARKLFLITQAGYLLMYGSLLLHLDESGRILHLLLGVTPAQSVPVLIALAISGIAVRLFLITSVGLGHPDAGIKYRRLFPVIFVHDVIWAAAPLLLFEKIGMGLAMASIAGLAYLPFSQRILMGSIYPAH